ncbi:MAG: gliding motility lipoprotein GldD [Polaribacter sp.]|nr:gliding motility lipoprotein GldD [Polaribacter sp.]MDG1810763.1 gliding motility lipoprotein GldD [Polaribacter sp.]MDG1994761.1 gliding motility lipoprotein GldD [Polaribacter sp.]
MRKIILLLLVGLLMYSCSEDVLPKPKAYLSLNYPAITYQKKTVAKPYSFEVSSVVKITEQPNFWRQIKYPKLKASIDITYRPVTNNLTELLTESEKLVYKHAVKAEEIITKSFENFDKRVFGSMQEISGNAASQIQFHITDSTDNFIKGALYFYAKPNYDSILPAVAYIKKDIIRLIETLEWNP